MRKLVAALNEKEVRHLLIDDFWEDDYSDPELYIAIDKILKEVEKLKGDTSYQDSIKNNGYEQNEANKIKFYYGLYYLFEISPLEAIEVIKETGIKQDTKEKVKKRLDNLVFDRKVEKEKEKGKEEIVTFEEMCVPIETYFNRTIDYDITVAKFIAYEDRIKKIEKKKEWLKSSKK